jgi:hypothetical protein
MEKQNQKIAREGRTGSHDLGGREKPFEAQGKQGKQARILNCKHGRE